MAFLSSLVLGISLAYSQDFLAEFQEHCKVHDTVAQLKVLKKWAAADPNSPELLTSYFNYHFLKAGNEVISMTKERPTGEAFELKDSLNQVAGYLGGTVVYNQKELAKGFDIIDAGIEKFPNRLDMRFGKIYALGEIPDWDRFTQEIIRTVKYSAENNNEWTWTYGKKKGGGSEEFLADIQTYQLQLYNTGKDELLVNMRTIAQEILKHYPEHVPSLSNISITYLITGQIDKGIAPLLKAEQLAPKDTIVLANIARAYELKGDIAKSIEYYQKIVEHGDKEMQTFANGKIEQLKKM